MRENLEMVVDIFGPDAGEQRLQREDAADWSLEVIGGGGGDGGRAHVGLWPRSNHWLQLQGRRHPPFEFFEKKIQAMFT